jgi:hypothetical protein
MIKLCMLCYFIQQAIGFVTSIALFLRIVFVIPCFHLLMSWIATEAVEEQYQKMLKSVEAETMPPNAWLWSMISSCSNKEDIKLLFQILQKLRVFVSS